MQYLSRWGASSRASPMATDDDADFHGNMAGLTKDAFLWNTTNLVRLIRTAFKIKLSLCVVLYWHDKRPIVKAYVSLKSCSATSRCSHHSQASPSIFVHNGAFLKCKYLNWVFIHFHLRTRWTCWLSLHEEKKTKKNVYSHRKPHKRQREQGLPFVIASSFHVFVS